MSKLLFIQILLIIPGNFFIVFPWNLPSNIFKSYQLTHCGSFVKSKYKQMENMAIYVDPL